MKVAFSYRSTDPNFEILAFPTRHFRPTDRRAQRGEENLGVGPPDRPTLPEAGRGLRPESDNPTDRPSPRPGRVPTLSRSSIRLHSNTFSTRRRSYHHTHPRGPTDRLPRAARDGKKPTRSIRPTDPLFATPRLRPDSPIPTDRPPRAARREKNRVESPDRPTLFQALVIRKSYFQLRTACLTATSAGVLRFQRVVSICTPALH